MKGPQKRYYNQKIIKRKDHFEEIIFDGFMI